MWGNLTSVLSTLSLDFQPHAYYLTPCRNGGPLGSFTLEPGRGTVWELEFRPQALDAVKHMARLKVARNPFEEYSVQVNWEGG